MERARSFRIVLVDAHKLIGFREREGLKQDGVDGGEDGTVGADGESEGEDHRDRESGRFPDEAEGGFEIGDSGVEKADAVDISQFFLDLFPPAELQHCMAAGFGGRHPRGDVVIHELFDVKAKLGIKLRVERAFPKDRFPSEHRGLLFGRLKYVPHGSGKAVPVRFLARQLLAALGRQFVKLSLPAVVGLAPLRCEPPSFFQAMQRRVQRALLHLQHFLGDLPDSLRNPVAVYRSELNNFQDQHIQRALQQVGFLDRHRAS